MSKAPNFAVSAEQNGARAIRASEHGAEHLVGLQIVKDNGTTGFGEILAGTPVGRITATGKYRPAGKKALSVTAAGGNVASMTSAKNFFVGDAVDLISTLGIAGALAMVASAGGDVIDITGKANDAKAHAFVLTDPSAAGRSLTKTETFSSAGVLTTSIALATSQHLKTFAVEAGAGTLTVTGKDGKAHNIALVDPSANGAVLGVTATFNASGIGTFVVSLATSGAGAITSTVNEVLAAINGEEIGDYVVASLGTAVGSETVVAVAAQTLAGGGVITSTVANVITSLNQGDSGEVITAAIAAGDDDTQLAIAVASAPLAGGLAAGGTLASNRTVTATDKVTATNTVTFNGGTVDLVSGDVIQTRDGSQTAVFILETTVSTYDESASRIAQAATYADRSAVGGFHGLYKIANLTGYDALMITDLGGTSLAAGTYLRL